VQAYLQDTEASLIAGTDSTVALTPTLPGVNLVFGRNTDPRVIIDTLSQVTDVRVVSAPSVSAFENEQAEIKVVEQVPIVTQQVQATTDANAPTVNSVEYRDAGVILRVTPQVSGSDLVNLQVKQELSAVVGQTNGQATLTPTLRQRSITTRVAVYDGQTVALGGLISTQSTGSKGGDALTRLLGGHRSTETARTELVVFITPHVIRDQQDASTVAQEIRRKMTMMDGQ
jgi:general secretion pathway protein D